MRLALCWWVVETSRKGLLRFSTPIPQDTLLAPWEVLDRLASKVTPRYFDVLNLAKIWLSRQS